MCHLLFPNAYWFQTSLNLGLETWNMGKFSFLVEKPTLSTLVMYFKKLIKANPPHFSGVGRMRVH